MKAIKYLSIIALAAGMVSCSDDLPDPPAQGYPDTGLVFEDANLKVSQDASEFNLKTRN